MLKAALAVDMCVACFAPCGRQPQGPEVAVDHLGVRGCVGAQGCGRAPRGPRLWSTASRPEVVVDRLGARGCGRPPQGRRPPQGPRLSLGARGCGWARGCGRPHWGPRLRSTASGPEVVFDRLGARGHQSITSGPRLWSTASGPSVCQVHGLWFTRSALYFGVILEQPIGLSKRRSNG